MLARLPFQGSQQPFQETGIIGIALKRPNPIPHPISRHLDVFPIHVPEELMVPGSPIIMIMRRLRIKFDVRPIVLKRPQCPPRMIPRGNNDGTVNFFSAHNINSELGVFACGFGIAFQFNGAGGHTQLQQNMAIDSVVASAAEDNSGSDVLKVKFRGVFGTLVRAATAKDDDNAGLMSRYPGT